MIYLKKNVTKEWLLKNGFRYNRFISSFISSNGDDVYTYRFPILKSENNVILECGLFLYYPEGTLIANVYKAGTTELYAPFYDREYGNYDFSEIDNKISAKLKKLGVEKVGV